MKKLYKAIFITGIIRRSYKYFYVENFLPLYKAMVCSYFDVYGTQLKENNLCIYSGKWPEKCHNTRSGN